LNEAGYMIALDDDRADDRANDRANDPREALAEVADIIKVELQLTTEEQRLALIQQFGRRCRLLAEKIETQAEFVRTQDQGFVYFRAIFSAGRR
jgi:c-di-GMP-related signal transduction protein